MARPTTLADRLLPLIRTWRTAHVRPMLTLGICGAQGSGKSTLAAELAARLGSEGLTVAVLSLDDLYLARAERQRLARRLHPLFATRGVPGTHDPALGLRTIDALAAGDAVDLPRFDKARDDPSPDWPISSDDCEILLFEGWCVGAVPQPAGDLAAPINALEQREDPQAVWRGEVNRMLAGPYRHLFARIDRLILLDAPGWEVVAQWREQQEAQLRAATKGAAARVMTPAQIARFVQHYERLTRWILAEMPHRADAIAKLGAERELLDFRTKAEPIP